MNEGPQWRAMCLVKDEEGKEVANWFMPPTPLNVQEPTTRFPGNPLSIFSLLIP